jgi:tetratricopeptide (TPR) repeat protein
MKFLKSETLLDKGNEKFILNDYKGAIQDFTVAVKLNPNNALIYDSRGHAKFHLEDYAGAIDDFTMALKIKPKGIFYSNRGMAKYLMNDKAGACLDWSKAGELGDMEAYDMIKKYCR